MKWRLLFFIVVFAGSVVKADTGKLSRKESRLSRQKRSVIFTDRKWLWPDAKVYYTIVTRTPAVVSGVNLVIKEYMDKTCLNFIRVDRNNRIHKIAFEDQYGGCVSELGYIKKLVIAWKKPRPEQIINIGDGCTGLGTVRHEIQHSLGVIHQQQARDRDQYIWIIRQNIQEGFESQFDFIKRSKGTYHGGRYDFKSNMHYESNAFSYDDKRETIRAKDPNQQSNIAFRYDPFFSFYDLLTLNKAYRCGKHCKGDCSGYFDKNCKCVQPNDPMFGGSILQPKWPPKHEHDYKPKLLSRRNLLKDITDGKFKLYKVKGQLKGQDYLPYAGEPYTHGKGKVDVYFIKEKEAFVIHSRTRDVPDGLFYNNYFLQPNYIANMREGRVSYFIDEYRRVWYYFWDSKFKPGNVVGEL